LRFMNGSYTTKELFDDDFPAITVGNNSIVFNPYDVNHHNYDNNMWSEYKEELASLGYNMIEVSQSTILSFFPSRDCIVLTLAQPTLFKNSMVGF
jgi:hypothetical protein